MNENYPYRFKTEEEFKKTCGGNWRHFGVSTFPTLMDHLLGQPYPFYVKKKEILPTIIEIVGSSNCRWGIQWYMLTENEIKPNYKPKGKIERTL